MRHNVRDTEVKNVVSAPTTKQVNKVIKELRSYGIKVSSVPSFSRVSDLMRWRDNLIEEADEE